MKRVLFIMFLMVAGLAVSAQNSTQGKEFWFSFLQNGYKYNDKAWVETQVMISAKRACSGTVSNPRTSWSRDFTVDDESVVVLSVPEAQGYNENNEGVASNLGLILTASDTVSVYIANCANNSFDASFVLPVESIGSNYILQSDGQSSSNPAFSNQETGTFLIVATEDNTLIDIVPSVATLDGHEAGTSYSVSLDRGQTYSMRSNNNTNHRDFSGTCINAHDSKKIAVFNGNTLTNIPNTSNTGHDHIFEQALPVEAWGQQFAITSSYARTRDQVKVTAGLDNDTVWCNGVYQTTLAKGQSFTFWLYASVSGSHPFGGGSCFIETSQPSMVYLYNATCRDPEASWNEQGDPSMVWIPPVEQKIDEITFCTFYHSNATIDNHYVNIVVDSGSVGDVYLDGNCLNPDQFVPLVGNENYAYAKLEINHGIHHLSCAWGLIAHVYGFGYVKGYAYCVGANVVNLTSVLFVDGQLSSNYHDGLTLCIGESADFEVRTSYPVLGVVWDFDGTLIPGGVTASHTYPQAGDFNTKAIVEGLNTFTNQPFYDTLSVAVHVGPAGYLDETRVVCDVDAFDYYGMTYTESGYYEQTVHNNYGCDSVFYLTLDMDFTPYFSIMGDHWPIGGSETYISVNEYAIQLDDDRTSVDTVIWQIDCENWFIVPHGIGRTCTLYIYSYLTEPVLLHATVINRCDTVTVDFAIKTTYFGVDETVDDERFTISPNPSDGHLTLHLDGLSGWTEIGIYRSTGQRIETFMMDADTTKEVDYILPVGSSGIYFIVLRNNGRTMVRKVSIMQ